jgi:hypothetical protein
MAVQLERLKLAGIDTSDNAVHVVKRPGKRPGILGGMVIDNREVQDSKARSKIPTSPSGRVIEYIELHPRNVFWRMFVISGGITIDVKEGQ